MDQSSDATFRALAEDWVMRDTPDGSTLTLTFAVEPQPELRELIEGARDLIGGVFARAMASLASHLRAS